MTTSPPKPRSALAALPVYKPGRSAEVAMAEHDLDAAVKLASNENPFSPAAVRAGRHRPLGGGHPQPLRRPPGR